MRTSLTRLKKAICATNMDEEATAPRASTSRPRPSSHSGTSASTEPEKVRSSRTRPVASPPWSSRACAASTKMRIGVAPWKGTTRGGRSAEVAIFWAAPALEAKKAVATSLEHFHLPEEARDDRLRGHRDGK